LAANHVAAFSYGFADSLLGGNNVAKASLVNFDIFRVIDKIELVFGPIKAGWAYSLTIASWEEVLNPTTALEET